MGGAARRSGSSFCRLLSKRRGQNKRFAGLAEQWIFKFCTTGWGFPYKPVQMMVWYGKAGVPRTESESVSCRS